MKKLLLLFILALCFNISKAQTTTTYTELNAGVSVGTVPLFPGASFLYCATTRFNRGVLLDYQGGLAFPSILTAKAGVGYAFDSKYELSLGARIWPSTTYLQLKSNRPDKNRDILFTIEAMSWSTTSFSQSAIFTVGWRHNIVK